MPKKRRIKCPYCGDAPINHRFSYINSVVSMFLDPIFNNTSALIPRFAVRGAEGILKSVFHLSRALGFIRLGDDPEKAVTLRSRVIWDEARRRGIEMWQVKIFGMPTDNFRAKVKEKYIYFNSLPLPERPFGEKENWDDKFFLKEKLEQAEIPVPKCAEVPRLRAGMEKLFHEFEKPVIVKPRFGSRGRHTTTAIHTLSDFEKAAELARVICPRVVAEEHLDGYVCRATCIDGKLVGFYRADAPKISGDGKSTIAELIQKKDETRSERIKEVQGGKEMRDYLARLGYVMESVLPAGKEIRLSHRTGRFFGGETREMPGQLHPSFAPVIEKAAKVTGLYVVGFDCIVQDPEASSFGQRWGIIEANTLPFIDLHYYALSGNPRNIAGMIWDYWQ